MMKLFKISLSTREKVFSSVQNKNLNIHQADSQIGIEQLHQIMVNARALAIARGISTPTIELLEESRSMMKKINDRN